MVRVFRIFLYLLYFIYGVFFTCFYIIPINFLAKTTESTSSNIIIWASAILSFLFCIAMFGSTFLWFLKKEKAQYLPTFVALLLYPFIMPFLLSGLIDSDIVIVFAACCLVSFALWLCIHCNKAINKKGQMEKQKGP
jgi:hypothetical protein